jgi:putative transcriptional regulator
VNAGNTTKKTAKPTKHDWSRFDTMGDTLRNAAATRDPDAIPLTPADFKRMKRTPQVKVIRRAFSLTQEEFAGRFHIPSVHSAIGSKLRRFPISPPAPISP